MKCIVNDDVVLSRPLEGPLSAHIPAFVHWISPFGAAVYDAVRDRDSRK